MGVEHSARGVPAPWGFPSPWASLNEAWDVQGHFLGSGAQINGCLTVWGLPAPTLSCPSPHSPVRILPGSLGVEPDVAVHIEEDVVLR